MFLKKLPFTIFLVLFITPIFAQNITIESTVDLKTDYKIIEIKETKTVTLNNEPIIVALANIRLPEYRVGAALLFFDLEGKLLKEQAFDDEKYNFKAVSIIQKEEHYYLLLNRMTVANNKKSVVLYSTVNQYVDKTILPHFDTDDISATYISSPNFFEATAMTIKNDEVFVTVSIIDAMDNLYPRLMIHNTETLETKTILNFDKQNRLKALVSEKTIDKTSKIRVTTIDKEGNEVRKMMTEAELVEAGMMTKAQATEMRQLLKECKTIKFIGDELMLVGQESSVNNSDFWVAKVVDNQIVWEDNFPSTLGGDEGNDIYKTENGYLVFGLDYTKNMNSYYSYRIVVLDKNGVEINHQKFNTGNKDWFKDVVAIGESQNQFLMFGQTQTITLAKSMFEEEKINTSNLWMILVNENGAKISELTLETDTIDEAILLGKISDNEVFGFYLNDENLKMMKIKINHP